MIIYQRFELIRLFLFFLVILNLFMGCESRKGKEEKEDTIAREEPVKKKTTEKAREIASVRNLGLAYLEENKLEEAEVEFLKLIELAPEEAMGYANLGIVYMRMGKYEEAEEQLEKAVELNPDDSDIRLNLAQVYDLTDKKEASMEEMEKSIEIDPDHVQTLYSLAETYQQKSDRQSLSQWEKYMQRIVQTSPSNMVARLYLIEALARNNKPDEALNHLEELGKIAPAFPDESKKHYDQAIENLQQSQLKEALTSVLVFHNFLKLTNVYQRDIQELKGTGTATIGNPVITLSEAAVTYITEGESILDILQFTDASASAGLEITTETQKQEVQAKTHLTHLAVGDMDRDGDQDIYMGSYDAETNTYQHFLFRNDFGRFENIATRAGIDHEERDVSALFADYNNDGFLDLFILTELSCVLYENISENEFEDVTARAGLAGIKPGNRALFFDMDQDGDLDLFIASGGNNQVWRNNGDGTFLNITGETGLGKTDFESRDAMIGDFDGDGDVDLVIANSNGPNQVFSNMRQGKFAEITAETGIDHPSGSVAVAVGDYNNDGSPDILFAGRENGSVYLYKNKGNGIFEPDDSIQKAISASDNLTFRDAGFFDFDNDGFLDIILTGKSSDEKGRGILLIHNIPDGDFENVTDLLPETIHNAQNLEIADYNEDGDLDIYLTTLNGAIKLIRNDGGNGNHHLKVQLVGLRRGSSKNNYYGIGARVEVRAGDLYQMKTVTGPNVHFGLGNRSKVDVVRIIWTNGVPQNIFSPGSDQDLIEEQELKGSCPFLYTWNGREYMFLKDMMWRSALGMPLGIMGGSMAYAFPDASKEYLKIPGDFLKAEQGKYKIQVTSELWETIYFDEVKLVAVDHPDSVEIFVDERFTPPPYPGMDMYKVHNRIIPRSVYDGKGNDLREKVLKKDHRYISNLKAGAYQGITEMHDLILDPGNVGPAEGLCLFLNGWIFPTDASINVALSQRKDVEAVTPYLQVLNQKGEWVTVVENMGFPMGKNKTVIVDLSDKYLSENRKLRIRTNMEIYWDHIFFARNNRQSPVTTKILEPGQADLHYRGFSAMYRKGGRYGPHWFDYYDVSKPVKWRDLTGYYTRYGDVNELLQTADNQYIIMNAGDEVSVTFDESELPPLPDGWTRDYLIYSVGWVKDGDMNTATGNTVEPLPFHGMKSYPYDDREHSPLSNSKFRSYIREYNTREVTNEAYKRQFFE